MLRIHLELLPQGRREGRRTLGVALIGNLTPTVVDGAADYRVVRADDLGEDSWLVLDHHRADGPWELAARSLTQGDNRPVPAGLADVVARLVAEARRA